MILISHSRNDILIGLNLHFKFLGNIYEFM